MLTSALVMSTMATFVICVPQTQYPAITFQTYIYQTPKRNVMRTPMIENTSPNLMANSRTVFPENSNRRYNRRKPPSEGTQVVRTPDGKLKILFKEPQRGKRGIDGIVFPGPTSKSSSQSKSNSFIAPPDPCGNGQTFCETIDNYPEELVDEILTNSVDKINKYLTVDEMDVKIEIGQRNDFSSTITMCRTIERVVFPKAARNKANKWLYLINQNDSQQGVKIELCEKPGSQCTFSDRFPEGYTTECTQKYIYRQMIAVDENGNTYPDTFSMPSCCSCSIRSLGDISTRIGLDIDGRSINRRNETKTSKI